GRALAAATTTSDATSADIRAAHSGNRHGTGETAAGADRTSRAARAAGADAAGLGARPTTHHHRGAPPATDAAACAACAVCPAAEGQPETGRPPQGRRLSSQSDSGRGFARVRGRPLEQGWQQRPGPHHRAQAAVLVGRPTETYLCGAFRRR